MNDSTRPNLGGLFNGSTPPAPSSGINGSYGPKLVMAPAVEPDPPAPAARDGRWEFASHTGDQASSAGGGAARSRIAQDGRQAPPPASGGSGWTVLTWIDPVTAVQRYFELLQAMLDVNRELALGLANAVGSLPRRVGMRR